MKDVLYEVFRKYYGVEEYCVDDPIHNILYHSLESIHGKTSELLREDIDVDAFYYHHCLNYSVEDSLFADTLVSFWTPYRTAIKKATGLYFRKNNREELLKVINKQDIDLSAIDDVNQHFYSFAKVYYSPGNYAFLPVRAMNNAKYRSCEDRIDYTLLECFSGGVLSEFFRDDEVLTAWIERERLKSLFSDGVVSKKTLRPILSAGYLHYSDMTLSELYEYIDRIAEFIEERNNLLKVD